MSTATAAQLTEEMFASVRAMPGFRGACEAAAADSVQAFVELDADNRWITKDYGRATICTIAAFLHYAGELTVQHLKAVNVASGVGSPGRVSQVVRRCIKIGQLSVEDGTGLWTRRRATLGPGLLGMLHRRARCDMKAAVSLTPGLEGVLEIVDTEEGAVSALMHLARVTGERPDLFRFDTRRPLNFFLDREAGMSILFDLLASQAPGRQRLLEAAPLSRYALARRYGVSRAHINKLLAESGHTEAIGDRVVFSEALSEAVEAHFALVFAYSQSAAQRLLGGWRFRRPGGGGAAPVGAA